MGENIRPHELADRLQRLADKHRETWRIEREPHNYKDGTTHFTHVVHDAYDSAGEKMKEAFRWQTNQRSRPTPR